MLVIHPQSATGHTQVSHHFSSKADTATSLAGSSFSKELRHSVCLSWEQGHLYVVALCEDSLWSLPNYKKRVYPFPFFREPELKCGLVPFRNARDLIGGAAGDG